MDNGNLIRPDRIQWMPGIREIDAYCQDATAENLERLVDYFRRNDGDNNFAVKLLAIALPICIRLERRIPYSLLGERAKEDPRVIRIALFALCGEIINRWSAEMIGLSMNPALAHERLRSALEKAIRAQEFEG